LFKTNWHNGPANPVGHEQLKYEVPYCVQLPPFWHKFGKHKFIAFWQLVPVVPGKQVLQFVPVKFPLQVP
jgi:hypothetical protein